MAKGPSPWRKGFLLGEPKGMPKRWMGVCLGEGILALANPRGFQTGGLLYLSESEGLPNLLGVRLAEAVLALVNPRVFSLEITVPTNYNKFIKHKIESMAPSYFEKNNVFHKCFWFPPKNSVSSRSTPTLLSCHNLKHLTNKSNKTKQTKNPPKHNQIKLKRNEIK